MRKLKNQSSVEDYEKNVAIFGIFIFIVFGVIFMTFLLPGLYNFKNTPNDKAGKVVVYESKKETNNYKSGLIYSKKNNFSEALNFFKKAVEAEPTNVNYLTELATTHYLLKNYEESIATYNKIISLEKDSDFAYNSIGNNYRDMNKLTEAETYYRKAIEINPYTIASYNNLALMYADHNENDKAIAIIKEGLAVNTNNTELKITLRILEK